jgi:hypothetical protein
LTERPRLGHLARRDFGPYTPCTLSDNQRFDVDCWLTRFENEGAFGETS